MKSITLSEKDIARFWSKVKIGNPDECWEWQAHKNNKGYGVIGVGKDLFLTSRVSWTINFGSVPVGLVVCHKCDNPACVNPNHLFVGTMKDNMDDKMRKGRFVKGEVKRGSSHTLSKIKESEVPEIRRMFNSGMTTRSIAEKYGVDSKTIWSIGMKISWKHVK